MVVGALFTFGTALMIHFRNDLLSETIFNSALGDPASMETVVILIQFDINDRHECNAPILRPRIRVQFALHSLRGHISSVVARHVCIIRESSFMGINLQFASSGSETKID